MPLQLMKLMVDVDAATDLVPTVERFFYVTATETAPGAALTITTADFFDDTGAVPAALPALNTNNSYYNVYVNGVLQMAGISAYTSDEDAAPDPGSLVITVPDEEPDAEPILAGSPVVLEVVNFTASTDTTVTT